MKYSLLISCTAALVCFADAAVAKSLEEIQSISRSVTVEMITGNGSGVIVHRQGNLYTVVTNRHVVCRSGNCDESKLSDTYRLRTPDRQVYSVPKASVQLLKDSAGASLDLAIIQFRSSRSYAVTQVADPDSLKVGSAVYTAGFPIKLGFGFGPGTAIAVVNKRLTGDKGGYTVTYNASTLPGMSGGGVFDQNGQLVAIHGIGDRERENTQVNEVSSTDTVRARVELNSKIGHNRGIPVRWLVQSLEARGISVGNRKFSGQVRAVNPVTADEFFIAGFNKFVEPGDDVLAGKREAARQFTRAIKLNPRYTIAYYLLASVYDQLQEYTQALANYNQAIATNPKYAKAYNDRGVLKQSKLNDHKGALSDFSQAIAIDPKYTDAYNNRGALKYQKLNDPQGALADYNQAIALDSKFAEVYINRGNLKVDKLNDTQGALADYNQAIVLNPKSPTSYYNRGLLKDENNDTRGALADYNQTITLDPKYVDAYYYRGTLRAAKLNDIKGALADYNQAIALDSKFANAYHKRGIVKASSLNDFRGALADYNQAISLNPKFAEAYTNRGWLRYIKLRDRSGGIADVRQAAKIARAEGNSKLLETTLAVLKVWGVKE
jgi:tetratricopeptide (TPR) repeat protein